MERFKHPTRADFWDGESADLFVVGDLNYTDVKKPRHFCRGFLEDGRGGEIRTPNTRIWNPLLCQLELHPCSYFKDLTLS